MSITITIRADSLRGGSEYFFIFFQGKTLFCFSTSEPEGPCALRT